MADISKMTDAELQRAIAEKLDLCSCLSPTEHCVYSVGDEQEYYYCSKCSKNIAPNYPCDDAAALGLLDEFDDVRIDKDGPSRWTVDIHSDSLIIIGSGDSKTPSRAICEAWLKAKGA